MTRVVHSERELVCEPISRTAHINVYFRYVINAAHIGGRTAFSKVPTKVFIQLALNAS
jgi:hypothetical protein